MRVQATFKKSRMNVHVPKPSIHLSFLTMLAGPALRNLVIPNEAAAIDRKRVNPKKGPVSTAAFLTNFPVSSMLISPNTNNRCTCGTASMKGSETWIEISLIMNECLIQINYNQVGSLPK